MFRRSAWTPDSLFTHFDAMGRVNAASVKAAVESIEHRFEGVNEFSSALKDQQNNYITRTEMFAWFGVAVALGALVGHFAK